MLINPFFGSIPSRRFQHLPWFQTRDVNRLGLGSHSPGQSYDNRQAESSSFAKASKTLLLVLPMPIGACLIAVCVRVVVPEDVIRESWEQSQGSKRRQEDD